MNNTEGAGQPLNPKPQIRYLNTDLEIASRCSLDGLFSEMTRHRLWGHVTQGEDGNWYAIFNDFNAEEPEPNVTRLLDALDRLSPHESQVLRQCEKIEFNIGYDCGDEPASFSQGVSNHTLRRIAQHGASLRVTLYPYVPPGDPRIKQG